jgi:hypothetical protein
LHTPTIFINGKARTYNPRTRLYEEHRLVTFEQVHSTKRIYKEARDGRWSIGDVIALAFEWATATFAEAMYNNRYARASATLLKSISNGIFHKLNLSMEAETRITFLYRGLVSDFVFGWLWLIGLGVIATAYPGFLTSVLPILGYKIFGFVMLVLWATKNIPAIVQEIFTGANPFRAVILGGILTVAFSLTLSTVVAMPLWLVWSPATLMFVYNRLVKAEGVRGRNLSIFLVLGVALVSAFFAAGLVGLTPTLMWGYAINFLEVTRGTAWVTFLIRNASFISALILIPSYSFISLRMMVRAAIKRWPELAYQPELPIKAEYAAMSASEKAKTAATYRREMTRYLLFAEFEKVADLGYFIVEKFRKSTAEMFFHTALLMTNIIFRPQVVWKAAVSAFTGKASFWTTLQAAENSSEKGAPLIYPWKDSVLKELKLAVIVAMTIGILIQMGALDPVFLYIGWPIYFMSFLFGWILEYFAFNFGRSRDHRTQRGDSIREDFISARRLEIQLSEDTPDLTQSTPEVREWEYQHIISSLKKVLGKVEGDIPVYAVDQADSRSIWGNAFVERDRIRLFLDHLTRIPVAGDELRGLRKALDIHVQAWRPQTVYEEEDYYYAQMSRLAFLSEWEQMSEFARLDVINNLWKDRKASRRELLRNHLDPKRLAFMRAVGDIGTEMGPRRWRFWGKFWFKSWTEQHWTNLPVDVRRQRIWNILRKNLSEELAKEGVVMGKEIDFSNPYYAQIAKLLDLPTNEQIIEQVGKVAAFDQDAFQAIIAKVQKAPVKDRAKVLFQNFPHLSGSDRLLKQQLTDQFGAQILKQLADIREAVLSAKQVNENVYAPKGALEALGLLTENIDLTPWQKKRQEQAIQRAIDNADKQIGQLPFKRKWSSPWKLVSDFTVAWQTELYDSIRSEQRQPQEELLVPAKEPRSELRRASNEATTFADNDAFDAATEQRLRLSVLRSISHLEEEARSMDMDFRVALLGLALAIQKTDKALPASVGENAYYIEQLTEDDDYDYDNLLADLDEKTTLVFVQTSDRERNEKAFALSQQNSRVQYIDTKGVSIESFLATFLRSDEVVEKMGLVDSIVQVVTHDYRARHVKPEYLRSAKIGAAKLAKGRVIIAGGDRKFRNIPGVTNVYAKNIVELMRIALDAQRLISRSA